MSKKDGGPAFPVILDDTRDLGHMYDKGVTGMSLRAYFAAKAMHAMISKLPLSVIKECGFVPDVLAGVPKIPQADMEVIRRGVCEISCHYADNMIRQLNEVQS